MLNAVVIFGRFAVKMKSDVELFAFLRNGRRY